MSFLQRFLPTPTREETPTSTRSSFLNVSEEQLEAHLNIARYGNFMLTDAVRPSYDLQVVPSSGYRHDVYQDADTGIKIPVLMGAASGEPPSNTTITIIALHTLWAKANFLYR